MPDTGVSTKTIYFAQERWPKWDFKNIPPKPAHYQIVKKQYTNPKDKLEIRI